MTEESLEPLPPLTRFGLLLTNSSYGVGSAELFKRVSAAASAAEESVFDSLWLPDHLIQGPVGEFGSEGSASADRGRPPMFDAMTLAGALAATTQRLRIGPLVSPVTYRHPQLLARFAASLDVISGGRALLGLGAGWDAEEHEKYGFPFPPEPARLDMLEEAVQVCRTMLDDLEPCFAGTYFSIDEAFNWPRPVSERVPILIGGNGEHRTLRIAARYADACNPIVDATTMGQKLAAVERHCEAIGRDPASLSKVAAILVREPGSGLFADVEAAFKTGYDGVIVMPWQLRIDPELVTSISSGFTREFG